MNDYFAISGYNFLPVHHSPGVFRFARCLTLVCLMALVPGVLPAQTYSTDSGRAEFTSSVPLHEFTGRSDNLVGLIDLSESVVDFHIDLTTLRTGIGRRDRDMRQALNTDQFPFAEFYGRLVNPFDLEDGRPQRVRVRGDFTIHGVTREVEMEGTINMTGRGLHVQAEWEINITDYEITPPRLLLVRVDEIQQVRIDALLTPGE